MTNFMSKNYLCIRGKKKVMIQCKGKEMRTAVEEGRGKHNRNYQPTVMCDVHNLNGVWTELRTSYT